MKPGGLAIDEATVNQVSDLTATMPTRINFGPLGFPGFQRFRVRLLLKLHEVESGTQTVRNQ